MLYVWTLESGQEARPVAVLRHGCSASVQARHVHPRFNPESSRIVFVSDDTGVGNIYDVSVADIRASGLLAPEKP
jgi:Tol biopolymer transport system component